MRVRYLKDGHKYSTTQWRDDIQVLIHQEGHRTTVKVRANTDVTLLDADDYLNFYTNFGDLYFLNGYQSWTDTQEYPLRKRLRNIKKSPHIISSMFAMDRYGDNHFYKYSIKKSHGYDIFYSKGKYECFAWSVNDHYAYLIFELIKDSRKLHLIADVKDITLRKGEEVVIMDYYLYKNLQEGLDAFNAYYPKLNKEKLFGYSSWYNYYQNINEKIILRDLEGLDSRFNLFQIDDGYETYVGDWLDVDLKKFPNGLQPIVDKIHEKGYKAGIWLAPFAGEKKSKLFKEHPDWFRKDAKGHFYKAGGNWSGFYALDLKKEEVWNYIERCLRHYMNMGIDFFKLDFLYSAGLGVFKGRSRAMIQSEAYLRLREILKGKLILGCGAHIMNSYGAFDYLRVGPDVSLVFDDVGYMRLFHRERPSTKVTIQNTIYRSFMNDRLFGCDPDVFLLRDENLQLSFEQRRALTKINALFGSMLLTSDNLATYDENKKRVLDEALDLFKYATVINYEKKKNDINGTYTLKGETHSFTYDTQKGVLKNER